MTDRQQDWRPSASLDTIRKRAELLQQLRAFFLVREVLEVETQLLSTAGNTDPNIESMSVRFGHDTYYLHTSPEFPMKRLLAAGSGSIYQICKVFRQGEAGRFHNPEFTMLEWYRPGFDHHALMAEVEQLLTQVLGERITGSCKLSYQDAFLLHAGFDPLNISNSELVHEAAALGFPDVVGLSVDERDAWLELLFDQVVVPALPTGAIVFIHDYPASQAALAQVREPDGVAERFEVYIDGVELANGFHELLDAGEQLRRFEQDNRIRSDRGQEQVKLDRNLIAGLASGMPACAGVALGLDRLLMLLLDVDHIEDVLPFAWQRA
ncbi:MAG: EF-P lysine aminoacylase EpmA [Granulosicoccaceae bacterium]|jgi:lysyl-tRNA synthetase class 2